jgi:hypothetical protein
MISMVDMDGDGQVSLKEFRTLVLHPNPGVVDMHKEISKVITLCFMFYVVCFTFYVLCFMLHVLCCVLYVVCCMEYVVLMCIMLIMLIMYIMYIKVLCVLIPLSLCNTYVYYV